MNKELTPLQEINEPICIEYTENSANDKLCYRRYQVDIIETALKDAEKYKKVVEIIKENCSIYTESLYPLGPAHWWNVHLKMRGYIADKEEKEKFDLLKEILK